MVVEYHDEIGALAQTFNLMTEKLEQAYQEIKGFAFQAVLAQRQEKRTQTLFGKFVPENVIHEFFANPEETLVGDNRVLAVLFSDIRSFTTISEKHEPRRPGVLAEPLLREHGGRHHRAASGIVDKYIGDAIKAFFGATRGPDAQGELRPGRRARRRSRWRSGWWPSTPSRRQPADAASSRTAWGIHYGVVTIGNIGTEKKKEYTVIGETVELAEHLEGLTKEYKQPLLISESLHSKVKDDLPCRLLDSIPWRGGANPEDLHRATRRWTAAEKEAWGAHNLGMAEYYERSFARAARLLPRRPEDPARGHRGRH